MRYRLLLSSRATEDEYNRGVCVCVEHLRRHRDTWKCACYFHERSRKLHTPQELLFSSKTTPRARLRVSSPSAPMNESTSSLAVAIYDIKRFLLPFPQRINLRVLQLLCPLESVL